ncbi:MAG TPA: hypothetical protein VLC98_14055 [Phnomibacter sp.]|nr:hypothetical protein [Phnomibacter sp.]
MSKGISAQDVKTGSGKANNKNYSYSFMEPTIPAKGMLILLPGWGENAPSVFGKTKLPGILLEKGFVTIVPQLHQTLFADELAIAILNSIIEAQSGRHGSDHLPVIIGGLSAGGAIAIGYAEHVKRENNLKNLVAVFAIDPPLDLVRMYRSAENKIAYSCKNKLIRKEGANTKNYLTKALDGSPEENPASYRKYAAFSANEPDGGNAKYLQHIPIRLYAEPDLDFVRNTYCQQLQMEDINAFDLEKLNKFLAGMHNNKAEYIATKGRGFHSWNIPEAKDCADWILAICAETKL